MYRLRHDRRKSHKEERDEYLIEGLGRHLSEGKSQSPLCYKENKEGKI